MTTWEFDREHYRLRYPTSARPALTLEKIGDTTGEALARETGAAQRDLVDVSERGLRFVAREGDAVAVGAQVRGVIHFATRPSVLVHGTALRLQAGEIAVQLDEPGVPWNVILSEQQALRRRFPAL
jgi:hypothetical protein